MLTTLNFSELLLGEEEILISGVGNDSLEPIPSEHRAEAFEIRSLCIKMRDDLNLSEFSITYKETTFRASIIYSTADTVIVLRRFPIEVPTLDDLNLHPTFKSRLLTEKLSGLVIIAGAYASGKTTTASAMVSSRLGELGGVAVTLEDPPEMPLEGRYTKGVCYQVWVRDGNFAEGLRSAARWTPSIIFLGEVRDADSAMEALKASVNGVLVILTIHGNSIKGALERLHALASGAIGANSDDAASILSSGLACVMHQKLEGESGKKRLVAEMLWTVDGENSTRTAIKDKQWVRIDERVTYQKNLLLSGRG